MPSSAITWQICSRSSRMPWPDPYCSATRPSSATSAAASAASDSSGSDCRYGMPPASETTSGRLATANSARMAEARMPAVRCAYRCMCWSRLLPVMRHLGYLAGSLHPSPRRVVAGPLRAGKWSAGSS